MHRPLFFLDEPHYHHLNDPGPLRFQGAALAIDGRVVERLRILREGAIVAETAVNEPSPALAFLPFARAGECRFDVEAAGGVDELQLVYADGFAETVFRYATPPRIDVRACIEALPAPSPELITATQGSGNVQPYRDSMIAAVHTLSSLLEASGADPAAMRSILDIGCGTGRALMGWRCADPSRRIAGVDINAELIAWSKAHLPGEWAVCEVLPPLAFGEAEFDLVQLISVFTHLPIEHQKRWIEEIRRVLRPGGIVFLTLHGDLYKRVFGQTGEYSEVSTGAIGSNAYATFHTRALAEQLFAGFALAGYFERGHDADPPTLFPVGSLQDVYVFRKV